MISSFFKFEIIGKDSLYFILIFRVFYRTEEAEFKFAPLLSCEGVATKFLFIGGHHSPSFIPGQIKNRHNFEGCLQQVYFKVSETFHSVLL